MLFSDEPHFWSNGYVNKQSCCIWSDDTSQDIVETPLYLKKVTIWCALWASGIISPYVFKNDDDQNVIVNDQRYRDMIPNFFVLQLERINIADMWFHQDSVTCHTERDTINVPKETFDERLISRNGPVN
ncbi:hypothetical protein Trydic_g1967 [Trypoxylus dichotomus]